MNTAELILPRRRFNHTRRRLPRLDDGVPAEARHLAVRLGLGLAATGAMVAAYRFAFRPWHLHWGATEDEMRRALPGDDLVPHPAYVSTRAITIRAPAEQVWPWLVQIGQGRGGFYSYTWLENLVGADLHNADRIVPAWQDLQVGDTVRMAPPERYGGHARAIVVAVEPGRALVLGPATDSPEALQAAEKTGAGTWAFILNPINAKTTRLIVRTRSHVWQAPKLAYLLYDPAHFIMERKMMQGIKQRAERKEPQKKTKEAPSPVA